MIIREEVDNLCLLSRIQMTDTEKDALARDLQRILGYVEQIRQVTLPEKPVESTGRENNTRTDDEAHLVAEYTEILLAGVPEREGNYIKVKKVIDASSSA